ncbi:MAG: exopolysaccharide biosynthesis polyprenyl glycosylphosphotransferase [Bacteroidetes Order II. Incertae sedis bacterium]|nr:exopolysaccharide biosynthesis polyprenyl glycosylphosphotransferase [Bacteroidetes Order II. bacterium]
MPKWLTSAGLRGLALLIHDVIALGVSIMVAYRIRLEYAPPTIVEWHVLGVVISIITVLYLSNSYHVVRGDSSARLALRAFIAVGLAGVVIAAVAYIAEPARSVTFFWQGNLSLSLFIFAAWSSLVRYLLSMAYQRWSTTRCWLVIVDHEHSAELERIRAASDGIRIETIDLEDLAKPATRLNQVKGKIVIQTGERIWHQDEAEGLVVDSTRRLHAELIRDLIMVRLAGVHVLNYAEFFEEHFSLIPILDAQGLWPIFSEGFALQPGRVNWRIKRALDFTFATLVFIAVSPIVVLLMVLVWITSPGPALFVQERIGLAGKKFKLFKLRTMIVHAPDVGQRWTAKQDERITPIGRVLRRYRLDEFPQLINVIRGEMSLVGPRPEQPDIVSELEAEIPFYDVRHIVKPGISGWAQVNYPYGSSVSDARRKLEYDLYYMKHYSLFLDLYVVVRTLRVVVSSGGR